MRLRGMARGHSGTSQDVHLLGDYFEVIGVHAGAVPTEVVELQSDWDGSDEQFPRDDMRLANVTIGADTAIATTSALASCPFPAIARGVNLRPETIGYRNLRPSERVH